MRAFGPARPSLVEIERKDEKRMVQPWISQAVTQKSLPKCSKAGTVKLPFDKNVLGFVQALTIKAHPFLCILAAASAKLPKITAEPAKI